MNISSYSKCLKLQELLHIGCARAQINKGSLHIKVGNENFMVNSVEEATGIMLATIKLKGGKCPSK